MRDAKLGALLRYFLFGDREFVGDEYFEPRLTKDLVIRTSGLLPRCEAFSSGSEYFFLVSNSFFSYSHSGTVLSLPCFIVGCGFLIAG